MKFVVLVLLPFLSALSAILANEEPHSLRTAEIETDAYENDEVEGICHNSDKRIIGRKCFRYVKGYDITGVSTTVDAGPMDGPCECMKACLHNHATCANWVWKFTGPGQHKRHCTLYSNFNLPPQVTLAVDKGKSENFDILADNPQAGGQVPHCTLDNTDATAHDKKCVSGPLWELDIGGRFLC